MYDLSRNVDTVFNQIQEFQDICTLLKNPKTDKIIIVDHISFNMRKNLHKIVHSNFLKIMFLQPSHAEI